MAAHTIHGRLPRGNGDSGLVAEVLATRLRDRSAVTLATLRLRLVRTVIERANGCRYRAGCNCDRRPLLPVLTCDTGDYASIGHAGRNAEQPCQQHAASPAVKVTAMAEHVE